jgi:hypothetical protein
MSERIIQMIPVSIQTWAVYESRGGDYEIHRPIHTWVLLEDEFGSQRITAFAEGRGAKLEAIPEDRFECFEQKGQYDWPKDEEC